MPSDMKSVCLVPLDISVFSSPGAPGAFSYSRRQVSLRGPPLAGAPRCLDAVRWGLNGQKNSIHCFVDQTNNFTTRADPRPSGRATNPVGSLLDADAPGDHSVFGTDANRHEDISHNGTSRFSGNAYSAEVADAAAGLRAPLRSLGGLLIKAQIAASANFWAINDGCSNSLRTI
jgi:hypothetical protein